MDNQGEYRNYNKGVTTEVNNLNVTLIMRGETKKPSKAVVVLTIHEVKPSGFIKYEFSGYDGWSRYGPVEINY